MLPCLASLFIVISFPSCQAIVLTYCFYVSYQLYLSWFSLPLMRTTVAELPTSRRATEWDLQKKWVRWRSASMRHANGNKILCLFHCDKQKHTQNVMATIFSSGCYVPYIYTIIATPFHFLRLRLSSIFCFIVVLGLYTTVHCSLQLHMTLITPILTPSSTMVRVNAWCVRSRL